MDHIYCARRQQETTQGPYALYRQVKEPAGVEASHLCWLAELCLGWSRFILDSLSHDELAASSELEHLVTPSISNPHTVVAVNSDHVRHEEVARAPLT